MSTTWDQVKSMLPIMVVVASIAGTTAVAQFQIGNHKEAIDKLFGEQDLTEEEVELIQRELIRRQGQLNLDLNNMRIEQKHQADKLDEILRLLRNTN